MVIERRDHYREGIRVLYKQEYSMYYLLVC